MTHSNAAIRAWLAECGPAICGDYIRLHGLTGKQAARIGQRMAGMHKDGVLTRTGRGGCGHPFVYAVAREVLSKQDAMKVALAAKAARFAQTGPKPRKPRQKVERLPRIPKPRPVKPEQVRVKPSRRIKEDGAFTVAAVKAPPVDKSLPDSSAFIAANPERFERLPSFLDRRAA